MTGLHEEAAADFMAMVSIDLQDSSSDLVRLCQDVAGKHRSKQYYLNTIEESSNTADSHWVYTMYTYDIILNIHSSLTNSCYR